MAKNTPAAAPATDADNPINDAAATSDQHELNAPPTGNDPPPESEFRKVLLLVDGVFGRCAEVVKVLVHEAEALVAGGHADDNPAAVAAHED